MKTLLFIPCLVFTLAIIHYDLSAQQNVGIGTVSPSYRLDVQSDPANTSLINVNSKVNYAGSLDIKAFEGMSVPASGFGIGGRFTGGFKGLEGICQGGSYSGISLFGVYGSAIGTAGSRVGVYGTASGGAINYGVWGIVNGGANHYGVFGQNTNLSGYAGYFNGRGLFTNELRTNDNLIVDDDLGIGTTNPSTKLQILAGSDASFADNGFIQTGSSTGWNIVLDDNEILARNNGLENDLFIQRDGGDLLLCALELGSVGIGLTAGTSIPAGYMFAVDGKIISEELRIQNSNNWPDYVFAEHYDLMPLDELKKSIDANKHLPNIPSASVVENDGILIGDMQKRMMEKIEELTLYILAMYETNKQQQAEIDQLKAVVSTSKIPMTKRIGRSN